MTAAASVSDIAASSLTLRVLPIHWRRAWSAAVCCGDITDFSFAEDSDAVRAAARAVGIVCRAQGAMWLR